MQPWLHVHRPSCVFCLSLPRWKDRYAGSDEPYTDIIRHLLSVVKVLKLHFSLSLLYVGVVPLNIFRFQDLLLIILSLPVYAVLLLGLLCHRDDACISNPCREGSQCDTNPISGMFNCNCPLGYVGSTCNIDRDECSIGEAEKVLGTPNASPLPDRLCSFNMPLSSSSPSGTDPCEHGGQCVNTDGSFTCNCIKGYAGPRCEQDVNECASNPCQNDGTCLDRIGDYACICMPGMFL